MRKRLSILFLLFFQLAYAQTANDAISRGNVYYKEGEFELAEKQYRAALPNETAQYNLANALVQQKRYKEALEVLNSLTTSTREPSVKEAAHYNTGVVYSKLQDIPASIEAYKNALRLNPSDKEARENLEKALQEQKKKSGGGGQSHSKSNMSQSQADQKLQQLQDREKKLQQQLQGRNKDRGGNPAQDW
jgi:Ca-activated chloride channel family protein